MLTRITTLMSILFLFSCGGGGDTCFVRDLEVTVGECNCADAYSLTIDFVAEGSDSEYFDLFARNNVLIGHYKLSELPITIDKFEMSGLKDDYIKVRLNEDGDCIKEIEFSPPQCSETDSCYIEALEITSGECLLDSSYQLQIDFVAHNNENELVDVYVRNNQLIGTYNISELPISIDSFPSSAFAYDYIKVCINDNPDCCEEIEFLPPECIRGKCEVFNLTVDTGECTSESTYNLSLSFSHTNASNNFFEVFVRNDERIGQYSFSQNPLRITDFPLSSNNEDYIKVCVSDDPDCCQEIEFIPPVCDPGLCEVFDLEVELKECTSDSTYNLLLDFEYENPGNEYFDVYTRNGNHLGYYLLADLPIRLDDFKKGWSDYDYIKVCINDVPNCCTEIEFLSPDCDHLKCEISNLTVDIGNCVSNNTYDLVVDFEYVNPSHSNFELFDKNYNRIGNYPLSALPLNLPGFEMSGDDYDYIYACMSDSYSCCKGIEFMPPDCDPQDCEINNIQVEIKECTSDSTYNIVLDFEYENPTDDHFDVYIRHGVHIGYYPLSDLPIEIIDFKVSWHEFDYIKVCINDNSNCCREEEFTPPEC